jgi:AcrR family transcriptional regulator
MPSSETAPEPKWRRLPEERPQQIIEAALDVFAERGLASARLEDIAKRAGVSKGTIYLYFPNKEALFREVVRQTVVANIERAERELVRGSATEQLRAYLRGYWAFVRSPRFEAIYRLVLAELQNFPDLAQFYSEEVVQRSARLIGRIIQHGIDSGEFRPIDPRVAARMLQALIVSHGLWCARVKFFPHMAGATDEKVLTDVTDFYLHAIQAAPGEAAPAPSPRAPINR